MRVTPLLPLALRLALFLAWSAVPEMAAPTPEQQVASPNTHDEPIQFKARTILTQVPVVVTDRTGKHIHDLKRSDFRVFQDQREEKLAVFEEITSLVGSRPATSKAPNAFNQATSLEQRALTVVVVDAINTNFLDQAYGRTELIKYFSEVTKTKRPFVLLLMSNTGVKRLVDATDNPFLLVSSLRKVDGEMPIPGDFGTSLQTLESSPERTSRNFLMRSQIAEATFLQAQAIDKTMRSFLSIAWSLAGFPGRKSLIWATGGFPFYLRSASGGPENPRLSLLYGRVMEALNDAQISVYPLDVRGLVSDSPGGQTADHKSLGSSDPPDTNIALRRRLLLDSTVQNLENFADMTGGRAFYNSNDVASGFRKAVEDSSSYYLLGYYLNAHDTKPGWHKLKVSVQRSDWEVRARSGFLAGNATLNPASLENADESFALASPLDSTGVPIALRWNVPALDKDNTRRIIGFHMVIPADSVIDESDVSRYDIDFIWEADRDGITVLKDGHTLRGNLRPERLADIRRNGVTYTNTLALKPGDYQVRFVVRDNLAGRIGSLTALLKVN